MLINWNSSGKFFAAILLVLLLGQVGRDCHALDPSWKISEYVQVNYRAKDGLSQDSVLCIARTRDGYLWFGGYQGVERFDGIRFVPLESPDHPDQHMLFINSIFNDSRGDLWIATLEGLFRYDGRTVKRYMMEDGLPAEWIYSVAEDPSGNLWIGSHEGLVLWNGRNFKTYSVAQGLSDRSVHYVAVDPDGTVWAGTQNGLNIFRNGKFSVLTTGDGLPNNSIWSILRDRDGSHWIGTEEGLALLRNGQFTTYTTAHGLPSNVVNCLEADRNGSLWIGTEGGLARMFQGKIESFTSGDGLPKDAVWAIHEDPEGSLWVGMSNGGVSRFSEGKMHVLGKREGLTADVVGIVYEDPAGGTWIGTDAGLNHLSGDTIRQFTTRNGLADDFITSILRDSQDRLWIGTMGGLNLMTRSGTIRTYSKDDGLLDPVVLSMAEDDEGSLWIGTNDGINVWNGKEIVPFTGLDRGTILSLLAGRSGNMWAATRGGLWNWKKGDVRRYQESDGLPTDRLNTLYEDSDGTLWIGTTGSGLVRFRSGKFGTIRARNGLRIDSISAILEDSEHRFWLSSNKGIVCVEKKDLEAFLDGRIQHVDTEIFGTSDGMRNAECFDGQQPSAWKDRAGRLWFATLGGAVVIDPRNMRRNPVPPPVVIEQMAVGGKTFRADRYQVLPPGSGNFELEFTALSFVAPEKMRFQYRLQGFRSDWVDAGARRIAQYTNIGPGRYTFQVRACNNDGIWNERGAAFSFELKPHFYQTTWFYALCALALALVVRKVHLYRVRRALEIERIRTRIATDLHDDIGAGLSQIAILSEVLHKDLQNADSGVLDKLGNISSGAHELIGSMSDIVWAVNPARDRAENLVQRMRRFAIDVLSNSNIDVDLDDSNVEAHRKLSPDLKRNIYLIFKESMNNIARHSGCKSVQLTIRVDHDALSLIIRDDGRGFVPSDSFEGHGLRSMKDRASTIGGTLHVHSAPGEGTTLSLNVPL